MISKEKLPVLIVFICCVELLIYFWSNWTSYFDENNFFSIHQEFIFDKSARLAGRVSSFIILVILWFVGFRGLFKIYSDFRYKDTFLVLITLFSVNHLIHLLFVLLRFRSHHESIIFNAPISIGGSIHGVITFTSIIVIPILLWKYHQLNKILYAVIILYLFNLSSFIIKTFLGKVKPPEHPAYHNQLGVLVISLACLYVLYRIYFENRSKSFF